MKQILCIIALLGSALIGCGVDSGLDDDWFADDWEGFSNTGTGTVTVSGRVTEHGTDAPVSGAIVTLSTGVATTTNDDGRYSFSEVSIQRSFAGTVVRVSASKEGYRIWPESTRKWVDADPLRVDFFGINLNAATVSEDPTIFVGRWANEDLATRGITRVEIRQEVGDIAVHMWGSCSPRECDWGEETGFFLKDRPGVLTVIWNPEFKVSIQEFRILSDGRLEVVEHTHFIDDSSRPDQDNHYYFVPVSEFVSSRELVSLSGSGTATIDGVLDVGEWDQADGIEFKVHLPGDILSLAKLLVMNDTENIYFGLRFERDIIDSGHSLSFHFDNDNDEIPEDGDDVILYNPDRFYDEFRRGRSLGVFDTEAGGTNDGEGAFLHHGSFNVYEMSHPLNTSDDEHDFSLHRGDTVGFFLSLRIIGPDPNGERRTADTYLPGLNRYGQITIR